MNHLTRQVGPHGAYPHVPAMASAPAAGQTPARPSPVPMNPDPQVGLRFRLSHPDGRQETLLIDAERALIGNAAHCEVRLPPEIAAHEHIEVFASGGGVHFATRALAVAGRLPMLDGAPLVEGRWPKASVLSLGGVQISVEPVDIGAPKARPPYLWILAFIPFVALAAVAFAIAHPPKREEAAIPDAPPLLPARGSTPCPSVPLDQRHGLAAEKLRIALAKRERSPFSPRDGLEAVLFFETAAACFEGAGESGESADVRRSADALREKLEEDYRVRRVRLEHAYRIHDAPAAKRELSVLVPMTAHQRGPYVEWLTAFDRAATAEIAASSTTRLTP